jgi:hypothetical protein
MGLLGAVLAVAPAVAHAQPLDLFYERTVMKAADSRCDLFAPELGQALAAAAAQAKGAALRAGTSADALAAAERAAQAKAASIACDSAAMSTAAGRVKRAFAGYARMSRVTYPGDLADWQADRWGGRESRWRLRQETVFGADRMSFGLAGRGGADALVAVGRFADGASPYGARLVLRDAARSAGPYLDRRGAGPTTSLPLERRMPPPTATVSLLAEAREPAGRELLARGEGPGWAFRFPTRAARALAALDPREAVAVEFLFPGDRVRRAYVEVGDFAAGQAFLQVAAR